MTTLLRLQQEIETRLETQREGRGRKDKDLRHAKRLKSKRERKKDTSTKCKGLNSSFVGPLRATTTLFRLEQEIETRLETQREGRG
jgi:predicted DNA-binding protein